MKLANLATCFAAALAAAAMAIASERVHAQTLRVDATEYAGGRQAPPTEPSVVVTSTPAAAVQKVEAPKPVVRARPIIVRHRPTGPAGPVTMPAPDVLVMMARASLSAVNQANFTGNYSVLHGMATPALQARVSTAQFGKAFADLTKQNLDLAPTLVLTPQFSPAPTLSPAGVLTLKGVFPSRPLQISFAIDYLPVDGYWLIDALSVSALRPDASTASADINKNGLPAGQFVADNKFEAGPTSAFAGQGDSRPKRTNAVGGPYVRAVYVQVSAKQDEAGAQAELRAVRVAYASIIGAGESTVHVADLGKRGTFYRALFGPYTPQQADRVCNSLKAVGNECFIQYN